ncbi:DUF1707 domain-containing protein [Nocardioides marmoriginsengisoli]|uniref:DUF1707 domain-containing protein n=1 Tax=Nocardioides marmoriginsengisoli TaxID=661483 RepID=A0A3N0CRR2_9ACTN|nr:DUF1707 domain-containing protein [Nocardioides marmoriginsengisoli]RNL66090.1 DUF1707 domain-containing protein [Nocardioides marmoriginsengisoli]
MDDAQRQPRDGDRGRVRDQIKRAVDSGRITRADGDIRLTNVASAQSMAELGLITRDLDQLEAVLQPGTPVSAAPPEQGWATPTVSTAATAAAGGVRRTLPLLIGVLVIALVGAAAAALVVFSGSASETGSDSGSSDGLSTTLPFTASPEAETPEEPIDEPDSEEPDAEEPDEPGADYELSAEGIRGFLATYRAKFSTTKVVDLTMYDDYVIVKVPVPGKARNTGWVYRDGTFSDFGGVSANFPGSAVIDTRKLDVPALMKNIAKARRTLNVEDYTTTYVSLSYRPDFDQAPNVNIYVSNEFRESGYLATELDGKVDRAYPFSS